METVQRMQVKVSFTKLFETDQVGSQWDCEVSLVRIERPGRGSKMIYNLCQEVDECRFATSIIQLPALSELEARI